MSVRQFAVEQSVRFNRPNPQQITCSIQCRQAGAKATTFGSKGESDPWAILFEQAEQAPGPVIERTDNFWVAISRSSEHSPNPHPLPNRLTRMIRVCSRLVAGRNPALAPSSPVYGITEISRKIEPHRQDSPYRLC